jgi:hypothetical protein
MIMIEGLWLGTDADAQHTIKSLERLLADLKAFHAGEGPTEADLHDAPLLEGYELQPYMSHCLRGFVYGHPILGSQREIHTSQLFAINPDKHWARTFSRYYRLGSSLRALRAAVDEGLADKS